MQHIPVHRCIKWMLAVQETDTDDESFLRTTKLASQTRHNMNLGYLKAAQLEILTQAYLPLYECKVNRALQNYHYAFNYQNRVCRHGHDLWRLIVLLKFQSAELVYLKNEIVL